MLSKKGGEKEQLMNYMKIFFDTLYIHTGQSDFFSYVT